MNTNGLELNVNDLIDQVIQLTEEKMLAEAKVERLEKVVDVSNDQMGKIIDTREAAIDFIYEQSDEMRSKWESYRKNREGLNYDIRRKTAKGIQNVLL